MIRSFAFETQGKLHIMNMNVRPLPELSNDCSGCKTQLKGIAFDETECPLEHSWHLFV
jgi:hypothetical protein